MAKRINVNLNDYYSLEQARARLSENAGREIDKNYPRTLAAYGSVRTHKLGPRTILYLKKDIDEYVVKPTRGPRKRQPAAEEDEHGSFEMIV